MSVRSPFTFRLGVSVARLLFIPALLSVIAPSSATAQDKTSHWGASVSFTPTWKIHDKVKDLLFEDNEEGTIEGSEFTVGFVRGSTLGGDWGVSFVRKPFKDGSGPTATDQDCFNPAQTICRPHITSTLTQGVYLNGVEFDWFKPFGTFAKRVQVGLGVGGGIAAMNGNVIKTRDFFTPTGFNLQGPTGFTAVHEVETLLAKDELLPYFPLIKLEAEGAVIVAPGFKIKVAGGLNFPALSFRVGAVYLFGAK